MTQARAPKGVHIYTSNVPTRPGFVWVAGHYVTHVTNFYLKYDSLIFIFRFLLACQILFLYKVSDP